MVLLLATNTVAAPVKYSDPLSHDNVIYKPVLPAAEAFRILPRRMSHSIRADKTISEESLRQYLASKGSPLSDYSKEILASPFWSTIIGICTIEQYSCSRLPGGTNWNLWGIGGSSGLKRYATAEEGITAINGLLAGYEARGYDTIERLNGYYVQPASTNWFNTVIKTKLTLELLP